MKTTLKLVWILLLVSQYCCAQEKKFNYSAGAQALFPLSKGIQRPGYGFGFSVARKLSRHMGLAADIEIAVFHRNRLDSIANRSGGTYPFIPLTAGGVFRMAKHSYFTVKAGLLIGLKNENTYGIIVPGIGYYVFAADKPRLDISIRFAGVPSNKPVADNSLLEKAGYSYLSLRVAYLL